MVIESIEIENFRAIRKERLVCDSLTVLVGRNGAGKSSFLFALDVFYDIASPITEEDFFGRDTSNPIIIRVTYGNLQFEEREEFEPYIRDNKLTVTKRVTFEGGRPDARYFAAAMQIPHFANIRSMKGKSEKLKAWRELVENRTLPDLKPTPRKADDLDILMNEYEMEHTELMKPIEREEQFFGSRNVGGGKLDKFTKFVLVPAVREASVEAGGKKGAIYQILSMIVFRKVNARPDIKEFKEDFQNRARVLYSADNLTELPELAISISETLKKFAPGSELSLSWAEMGSLEVQLPEARATLIEDDFEGDISRKGHGLQRALIMTLLQHLAMASPTVGLKKPSEATPADSETPKPDMFLAGPDLILAIEEPELYLHPSRCRYLADLLLLLSESPEIGLGAKNQVIYTTHSPYFVDLDRFDQIRRVSKKPSLMPGLSESAVTHFSTDAAKRESAVVYNADPESFTWQSFRARAIPIMNTVVNEGYFADVVVVVEGLSEVGVFWKLQDMLNKNWNERGIVLVPAGSKNNIDRPTIIFRGFSIPTYFVFDGDARKLGKEGEEETKERNHRYLRLADAPLEDFPSTQVHRNWAVFGEDLESEINRIAGNDTFRNIQANVAHDLGYDKPNRAMKNIEGAGRCIELVYERGSRIPVFEEIIERITDLHAMIKMSP